MAYNYENKDLQNKKVRQAIAKAINKEDFTKTLLNNNGTPAVGAFPSNFSFGNEAVTADTFDLDEAKKLLKEAGYEDSDNDGYVDKDGNADPSKMKSFIEMGDALIQKQVNLK